MSNTSPLRITAAAGTKLAGAFIYSYRHYKSYKQTRRPQSNYEPFL